MPRDLFGDVTAPSIRLGSRKWYTVPLSLAAHTLVLATVIIVPLLATGTLPMPYRNVTFEITQLDVPEPPVAPRRVPSTSDVKSTLAPVEAPATIEKESGLEAGFETGVQLGIDAAVGLMTGLDSIVEPPPPPEPRAAEPKPVRIGGDIRPPEKIHDVSPAYPAIAQAARVQGTVIIEATIGVDGRVQNARILRSVPLLDESALAAVRQWIYTPTRLNGVPVGVIMTVTVRFQLN
jgi:protein TonB